VDTGKRAGPLWGGPAFPPKTRTNMTTAFESATREIMKAPGIYYDMPDADYRKAPGISQTSLKPLALSAGHYKYERDHPPTPTAPMIWGRIAHHLLLTPTVPPDWVERPRGMDGRSKKGKDWKKANANNTTITAEELDDIHGCIRALKAYPLFQYALAESKVEVSIFSRFQLTRLEGVDGEAWVNLKGRLDMLTAGRAICDTKFVDDATDDGFAKLVAAMQYYKQAAFYLDLFNAVAHPAQEPKDKFIFFAVEKTPPYPINMFELPQADIDLGREEYIKQLEILWRCERENAFPIYHPGSAYSQEVKPLLISKFARTQINNRILS